MLVTAKPRTNHPSVLTNTPMAVPVSVRTPVARPARRRGATTRLISLLPVADARQLVQGTLAWKRARRGMLTASVVPNLLGLGFGADEAFERILESTNSSQNMVQEIALATKKQARRLQERFSVKWTVVLFVVAWVNMNFISF